MYIIMVISQFAKIYGNVAFIMVVAVGAQPRQQSVGKALRSSVLNISAVLFSTAYALLVGVILHKIDPGGAANTAISRWAALTVHMLFTTMLRARFPDMIVAHCISSITVTLLFSSVTTGLPLALTIAISEPLISVFCFGELIALFFTCTVRPVFARREYRQAIGDEFVRLGEILEGSLKLLLRQDQQIDVAALRGKVAKSRASIPAIEQWKVEACLELGVPFWHAPQADSLVRKLYVTATTIHATSAFAIEHAQKVGAPQTRELFFGLEEDEQPALNLGSFAPFMCENDDAILLLPPKARAPESPRVESVPEHPRTEGEEEEEVHAHSSRVSGSERDPVDQEIHETVHADAAMSEGDADAHRHLLELIGERVNALVEAEVYVLQTMQQVAINGKQQGGDTDAIGFPAITRIIQEIEQLVQKDGHQAVGRGLRIIRLNYVLSNLLELAVQMQLLNCSVEAVFAPASGASFSDRVKKTLP